MSDVELSVDSGLSRIQADLELIRSKASEVEKALQNMGQTTSEQLANHVEETDRWFDKLLNTGRDVSKHLKEDFRALFSINAITESLKISKQFGDTVRESTALSDSIRKLGGVFGIAQDRWTSFHRDLTQGLGQVGLSSTVAKDALEALADSPVRGEKNLMAYARTAGQLATATNQPGRSGEISAGLAKVVQAQGGNPNDPRQMNAVAADITRVFQQTGKGAADTLKAMAEILQGMPEDLRKVVSTKQLAQLGAASQVAGPGSTRFLEEFLGKSKLDRMGMEALGLGGVFGANGIDINKLGQGLNARLSTIGFDPEKSAGILGISQEAAKGAVRFARSMDQVKAAMDGVVQKSGDFEKLRREGLGFSEGFHASVNRVKGMLATPLADATMGGSAFLGKASQSDAGAIAVTAGAGIVAALLAGYGLRGAGAGVLGTAMRGAGAQAITGKETIPVYVVNAKEIGSGMGALGDLAGKGLGLGTVAAGVGLGTVAAIGGAVAYAGYKNSQRAEQDVLGPIERDAKERTQAEDQKRRDNEHLAKEIAANMHLPNLHFRGDQHSKVVIELNDPRLKVTKQPSRGASY